MGQVLSFPTCWIGTARDLILTPIFSSCLPCAEWAREAEQNLRAHPQCHHMGSDMGTQDTAVPPVGAWTLPALPQGLPAPLTPPTTLTCPPRAAQRGEEGRGRRSVLSLQLITR